MECIIRFVLDHVILVKMTCIKVLQKNLNQSSMCYNSRSVGIGYRFLRKSANCQKKETELKSRINVGGRVIYDLVKCNTI